MALKITLVYLYSAHRQFKEQSLSSLGRTVAVKFSSGGKVTKEEILNDSVMNLPTDSCQLAGVLAKPFSVMDRTSTDKAFAQLQLENGWWWIEMTLNIVCYLVFDKRRWASPAYLWAWIMSLFNRFFFFFSLLFFSYRLLFSRYGDSVFALMLFLLICGVSFHVLLHLWQFKLSCV